MTWELTEYAGPGPLASGTVRSDMVRRDGKAPEFASQAFRGESTDSGFDVDDDDAAYEPPIIKQWALTEDASGADVFIWRGRLIRHLTRRGDHAIGDARLYEATLNDVNWELRKLRVHGWARPAETDVSRAQALGAYILNGSASTVTNARKRPSTVIDVTTYVPNTNTVDLPAKTYDGTDPWGVLDDIAAASGKEWFVYCADDGSAKLFYDLDTSMALVSPLTITDLDPDLITEFPPETPATTGDRDGSEFLSGGAHLYGDGGIVTHFNAAAEAAYDVVEDTLYDSAESEADAAARLEKLIDERDQPEPRIETAVWLPPTKVHQAKAGMMIAIRSGDAGLTSLTTLRIRRAAATPPLGASDGFWHVQLELAYPKKERPRLRDRGRLNVIARREIEAAGPSDSLIASCNPGGDVAITGFPWDWTGGVQPSTTGLGSCVGPGSGFVWGQSLDTADPSGGNSQFFSHDGGSMDFPVTPGDIVLVSINAATYGGYPPPAAVALTIRYYNGACVQIESDADVLALGAWSGFDFAWHGSFEVDTTEFVVPVGAARASLRLGASPTWFTGWMREAIVSVRTPPTGECYQESI